MSIRTNLSVISCCAAICIAPLTAISQPKVDMDCKIKRGSDESCAPLVACIGVNSVYFTGRALGWDSGLVTGTSNAGFSCIGTWKYQNMFGLGQARLACKNGMQGIVYFTAIDNLTGTVTGHGATSDGQPIRVWSGHNIQQFLAGETGDVNARLMCGHVEIPLS